MQYLKITNSGEVDHRAMTLLGASDKREDADSIGFFGSGNKYALACLLRAGLTVRIFSGVREIQIETKEEIFRNKLLSVIWINGEATSITTETGPKWKVIDAVREFWSNALDEGFAKKELINDSVTGVEGFTCIYVEMNSAIEDMVENWETFFIDKNVKPLFETENGKIYDISSTGGIANYFRRGVWCCEGLHNVPLFSYSFQEIDLPESRLVSAYEGMRKISQVLRFCDNETVLDTLLNSRQGMIPAPEWSSMEHVYDSGVKFYKALKALINKRGFKYIGQISNRERVSDADALVTFWAHDLVFRVISQTGLPNIMEKREYQKGYKIIPWPIGVKELVMNEVAALERCGLKFTWPVHYAEMVNKDHLALADAVDECILISSAIIIKGEVDLRKGLIEEYIHMRFAVKDLTVAQQHAYLLVINELIVKLNKGERND